MQKVTGWALLLGCLCGPAQGQSTAQMDQQQRFLEQMRVGEALYREDLVRDALARLNLIAPDQPPVLVAGIRQALLQQDQARAVLLFEKLQRQAPDSPELFQARNLLKLQSSDGQKRLHQARTLAEAGKAQDAVGVYLQLFGDAPPDLASALEYWRARGAMPGQQVTATEQLRLLDRQYPGNVGLQLVLANLLIAQKKDAEGLAVLHRLAADPLARNAAAEQEYNYLARQPVSPAGAKAWQDFLARYPGSPLNDKANGQLQQQQRLPDPTWRATVRPRPSIDAYWSLLRQGDQAMRRKNLANAQRTYQQARKLKPNDPWALVRLSTVAQAKADDIAAEALLVKAYRSQPASAPVTQALVGFYQAHAPQKLEAFLDTLPSARQREYGVLRQQLVLARLSAQADDAEQRADWAQVNQLLLKARTLDGSDPWLALRLAKAQRALGQAGAADETMRDLMQRQPRNPEVHYAHALYLSANGRDGAAMDELRHVPQSTWNPGMRELAGQVQHRQALQQALQKGEAQLGLIESLIASGQTHSAQHKLDQLAVPQAAPVDYRRRLANAWAAVGDAAKADALFTQLLDTPETDALTYRDGARLIAMQQPQRALDRYAKAMAGAGLLTPSQANPRDDRATTLASREKDADDWLPRSLRSEVDELYTQQNPTAHLYHDFTWRNDDTVSGLSDLTTQTTILRIDAPLGEGQGFVQAENVALDAGRFDTDADGLHRRPFGTCAIRLRNRATGVVQPNGCPGDTQSARGTGLALGWHDEHWALDVGHSPEGFEVFNWLGGVSYSNNWNTVGWKVTASRRPVNNSLLAYAGAVDPVTGIRWGGVTANGATLDLSHDLGGVDGIWASVGAHWLRGENVADNQRRTAMAGYYYKLIERADEQLRTGLTVMYWGYDKDLSEYTLGQGGYYSPQQYYSIGVPLNYAWRNAEWSVRMESSLGWSYAKTRASELYPLEGEAAQWLSSIEQAGFDIADDRAKSASASSGTNVRLQGFVERRLSDHLVLGGGLTWQHSQDYAPSRALLYLRYTFDPWQGNLPLPIEPITSYADWR